MPCDSFGFNRDSLVLESNQFRDPLSFGIPDEPPCYVGQYASMRIKSHIYLFICLEVIILHLTVCTMQYTTAHLQVLFSLLHLGRITKGCSNNLIV